MNIILIGPPGSGKGTQSKFIISKYNLLYISVGDILRNISIENNLYHKVKDCIKSGKLVDDFLIVDILNNYIDNFYKKYNGILIDGFPRNINQANLLEKIEVKFDLIIEFTISYKLIIDRISGRMIHEESGRIYNNKFNPPLIPGIDDITGDKLSNRIDDNIETIKNRLDIYNNNIFLLRKYFFNKFKNNNLHYNLINSGMDNNLVKYSIYKVIDSFMN